jgi:hypothetical protein
MICGSVVVHRRRCGKRNCRCAAGDLHEASVLSYSERGRTRFVMLPQAEVAAVATAVERYRAAEAELAAAGVDAHFAASRALFESALGFLDGAHAAGVEHAELETELDVKGRELVCQLRQDHLELRAQREQRLQEVLDAEQVTRGSVETGHTRALITVFGEVRVTRLAYRRRGHAKLYPADAQLNLPVEKHSHGLRKWGGSTGGQHAVRDSKNPTGTAPDPHHRPMGRVHRQHPRRRIQLRMLIRADP